MWFYKINSEKKFTNRNVLTKFYEQVISVLIRITVKWKTFFLQLESLDNYFYTRLQVLYDEKIHQIQQFDTPIRNGNNNINNQSNNQGTV